MSARRLHLSDQPCTTPTPQPLRPKVVYMPQVFWDTCNSSRADTVTAEGAACAMAKAGASKKRGRYLRFMVLIKNEL